VAIYTHKGEITIMRLVGASKWFIQMPYLISSLFYTAIGIISIMLVYYPFLSLLQPYMETFFVGYNVNLITYFYSNAFEIFGLQFLGISAVNMIASQLAVRKYSNI
jgi:cell division protein FtsX